MYFSVPRTVDSAKSSVRAASDVWNRVQQERH